MPMRRNAGLGMARVLEKVDEIAMVHQPDAVGAAGHIDVYPNSRNVIPGKAVFTVDFRSPEAGGDRGHGAAAANRRPQQICRRDGPEDRVREGRGISTPSSSTRAAWGRARAAERLGYSHKDLISGAGHDACWINRVAPTAMVMCPCVDGLSHNEAEEITPGWARAGAEVLMHAVVETAEIVK